MRVARLRKSLLPALVSAVLGLALPACGGDGQAPTPPVDSATQALNYHQDAKAVIEHYCTSCHQSGGIAPFELSDYASAKNHAAVMKSALANGTMPPWLPADDSLPVRYSRRMADADRQLLLDWLDGGAVEGDAQAPSRVSVPPAEQPLPPRHDLTLKMAEPYTPNQALSDDYRCFIIDPSASGTDGLAQDSYVQAGTILPGTASTVHHVIVFEVTAENVAAARKKDAAEAGPGYTCFGGPGVGESIDSFQMVMGWAPGGTVMRLTSDEAVPVKKGSIFVMQVHYNLQNFTGQADLSQAYMELAPTPPPYLVKLLPMANPSGLKIPANDKDAVQTILVPVSLVMNYLKLPSLTIVSVTPHMHVLGTQIITSIDGQALIDIPKWNFHWQQSYMLTEPYVAQPNQNVILECHYDNSAANQPLVNGMPKTPVDVKWGEGTTDEMCLSFIGIRYPMMSPGM